jgi:hypothetical protein
VLAIYKQRAEADTARNEAGVVMPVRLDTMKTRRASAG